MFFVGDACDPVGRVGAPTPRLCFYFVMPPEQPRQTSKVCLGSQEKSSSLLLLFSPIAGGTHGWFQSPDLESSQDRRCEGDGACSPQASHSREILFWRACAAPPMDRGMTPSETSLKRYITLFKKRVKSLCTRYVHIDSWDHMGNIRVCL